MPTIFTLPAFRRFLLLSIAAAAAAGGLMLFGDGFSGACMSPPVPVAEPEPMLPDEAVPKQTAPEQMLKVVYVPLACEGPGTSDTPTSVPPPTCTPEVPPAVERLPEGFGGQRAQVTWSKVRQSDACFFFSGPEPGFDIDTKLGNEAGLIRDGRDLMLTFGGDGFEGSVGKNGKVTLKRRSYNGYDGGWGYTERIVGKLKGNKLTARYEYRECELKNGHCPTRSPGKLSGFAHE